MDKIDFAENFARVAHHGQYRKYTGEHYANHPFNVSLLVKEAGGDEDMQIAALLHDVVEDTPITLDIIDHYFGSNVMSLVFYLTDISKPEDGNRAKRKAIDRGHTQCAPLKAQIIKCADLIDNTRSITKHDPDFAKVYMHEKRLLLDVMSDTVHNPLWSVANAYVKDYFKSS